MDFLGPMVLMTSEEQKLPDMCLHRFFSPFVIVGEHPGNSNASLKWAHQTYRNDFRIPSILDRTLHMVTYAQWNMNAEIYIA